MKIDLRTMTPTERELAEAALEKLDEAVAAYEYDEDTSVYLDAGTLAKALRIIQARKQVEQPAPRKRKPLPTPEEAQAAFRDNGGAAGTGAGNGRPAASVEAPTADAAAPTTSDPDIPGWLDRRQTT